MGQGAARGGALSRARRQGTRGGRGAREVGVPRLPRGGQGHLCRPPLAAPRHAPHRHRRPRPRRARLQGALSNQTKWSFRSFDKSLEIQAWSSSATCDLYFLVDFKFLSPYIVSFQGLATASLIWRHFLLGVKLWFEGIELWL